MTCPCCNHPEHGDVWVFVSGPYTHPDPVVNTRTAIDAGEALVSAGYVVIVPHLSLFTHLLHPHDVDYWYEYDLRLMRRCDVTLRLPGPSSGADDETAFAETISQPVFFGTAGEFIAAGYVSCKHCGELYLREGCEG